MSDEIDFSDLIDPPAAPLPQAQVEAQLRDIGRALFGVRYEEDEADAQQCAWCGADHHGGPEHCVRT